MRRRLTVRSTPPGALVFIDGQEIGRTPVSTQFTYYGTRNFRLVKDGYETISVNQRFPTPWYQVPPLDFVSENIVPREIRDERTVNFELVPKANVSTEDVLIHGEQLRSQVRQPADRYLTQSPEVTLGPAMDASRMHADTTHEDPTHAGSIGGSSDGFGSNGFSSDDSYTEAPYEQQGFVPADASGSIER